MICTKNIEAYVQKPKELQDQIMGKNFCTRHLSTAPHALNSLFDSKTLYCHDVKEFLHFFSEKFYMHQS